MPTPFAGAAATDATIVPWYSSPPKTLCVVEERRVRAVAANSGCVGSTPLSTIVIGTPGPGGVARSAPMSASHHSWLCSGSAAVTAGSRGGGGCKAQREQTDGEEAASHEGGQGS